MTKAMTRNMSVACAFAVAACAIWGSAGPEAHAAETPERFRVKSFAEVLPLFNATSGGKSAR